MIIYSENSGGFNNLTKMVHQSEQFVKSLRSYNRPTSSYTKQGGKLQGLKLTPSNHAMEGFRAVTPLREGLGPIAEPKIDYLVDSQLTFDHRFLM